MDKGFIISDIGGRRNQLLKEGDYNSIKQCKTYEDMLVKLNHYFPFITENLNKEELRSLFIEDIKYQLSEFGDLEKDFLEGGEDFLEGDSNKTLSSSSSSTNNGTFELKYFIEYYKIINFFNKIENVKLNQLGYFTELNIFNLCSNNFKDVKRLLIDNCFLKKYFQSIDMKDFKKDFKKEFGSGNWNENVDDDVDICSKINTKLMSLEIFKRFIDKFYSKSFGYLTEIIKVEGDRQILEIVLNSNKHFKQNNHSSGNSNINRNSNIYDSSGNSSNNEAFERNKLKYFPKYATTLNHEELTKLNDPEIEIEEVCKIFKVSCKFPFEDMIRRITKYYINSFCQYEDTSCVYSYFKLKEIEMENIMWIINCKVRMDEDNNSGDDNRGDDNRGMNFVSKLVSNERMNEIIIIKDE